RLETSPDNAAWTVRHSAVLQKTVTPMAVELSSGTGAATTNPGTAIFSNFHLGDKFSIGGQVKVVNSNGLGGVLLTLSGFLSLTTTTDGNGNYAFTSLDAGKNFLVTPSLDGY